MRIFSTFTGIGGFELGIQNAYRTTVGGGEETPARDVLEDGQGLLPPAQKDISTQGRLPGPGATGERTIERPLFVGYSEIDPYAIPVYERHFKGAKNYGDITKINAEQLPDFDCLVGGFPCQPFSNAGRRAGFEDTRGTLFFDLARILRAKKPRLFVFENVKGLLSHDGGRTFATIISAITELGYDCQWQLVNSKNYGVPQNRERIIIVGHLRGTPRPQVFPLGGGNRALTSSNTGADDNAGPGKKFLADAVYKSRPVRVYEKIAPTVIDYGSGGNKMPMVVQRPRGKNSGNVLPHAPTITGKSYQDNNHLLIQDIARRMTPLETERLQGFPDNWTAGYSDRQRYKMCGNAVTTNVIQAVFEGILK